MPFSAAVRERALERNFCFGVNAGGERVGHAEADVSFFSCEVCGDVVDRSQCEVHSMSSFHLEQAKELQSDVPGERVFEITDTPQFYADLQGSHLSLPSNILGSSGEDDAMVACTTCHQEIGRIALEETRQRYRKAYQANLELCQAFGYSPEYAGKEADPAILQQVSAFFRQRHHPVVLEGFNPGPTLVYIDELLEQENCL